MSFNLPEGHEPPVFGGPFDPSSFHAVILEPKSLRPSAPGRGSARDFRSVSPPGRGDSASEVTAGLEGGIVPPPEPGQSLDVALDCHRAAPWR